MGVRREDIEHILGIGERAPRGRPDPRLAPLLALAAEMAAVAPSRDSPVREVPARLGDSWSTLLLKVLAFGTFRHTTLKRIVSTLATEEAISQRMLTLRLRALERDGFVLRTVHDTVPPRVEYRLSPLGAELVGEFDRLLHWILAHQREIEAARSDFAAR